MSQKRWTITFSPAGEGEYQVAVRRSGAVHRFTAKLPPDISDLWQESNTEDGAQKRSFRSPEPSELSPEQRFFQAADLPTLKVIGERVLETIFDAKNASEGPKIIGALEDRISDNEGVSIEFDLSETAELSAIPWESVYLPSRDRFLAIGTTSNLIRKLDAQSELPDPIERPIRILVAAANPRDDLDTDVELGNIERRISELVAEGSDTFEVKSLPKATRDDFRRLVLTWKPHIIHYIGHSAFKDGKGYLYFESEKEGESDKVSAETLRNMLLNNRPWLVVLNSCQSGQTSRDAPMAGVAQNLLQRLNVPFVVAMQQPVSDDAAINFSQDFYTSLTDGESIANAVTIGRCAIANDDHPLTQLELITPALYTSGETDRILFADTEAVVAAVPETDEKEEKEEKKGFLGIIDEKTATLARILTSLTVIGTAAIAGIALITDMWEDKEDSPQAAAATDPPDTSSTGTSTPIPSSAGMAQNGDTGASQPDPQQQTDPAAGSQSTENRTVEFQVPQSPTRASTDPLPRETRPAARRVFRRPAVGETIAVGGRDFLVLEDGAMLDDVYISESVFLALLNEEGMEPAAGMPYQGPLAFESAGAPSPVTELGGSDDDERLGEPLSSVPYWDYRMPLVPADSYLLQRPAAYCDGLVTRVFFDHGSTALTPAAQASLAEVLDGMGCPGSQLIVAGFADTTGEQGVNGEIALERAQNVTEWLLGSDEAYVYSGFASSYGEQHNVRERGDDVREPLNRRTQIYFSYNCYSVYEPVATVSSMEAGLPRNPSEPYIGPSSSGELSPVMLVMHVRDLPNTPYYEMSELLTYHARHLVNAWGIPPGAIFPMIVGDGCLADEEAVRVEVGYWSTRYEDDEVVGDTMPDDEIYVDDPQMDANELQEDEPSGAVRVAEPNPEE